MAVEDLHAPTLTLRIFGIHTEEVSREERSLIPACPSANFNDDALLVIGVSRQQEGLQFVAQLLLLLRQLRQLFLAELAHLGIIAGFFKSMDGPLMRLTDLFLALPLLPLLLVVIMLFRDTLRDMFGPEMGIFILVVTIIGVTSWMQTARIVRGDVLSIKKKEFVLAAHSIGTKQRRMLLRHIFPNTLSPVMVSAALGVAVAIITESALSFLGLGFPSDFPTWGRLLYDAKDFLQFAPMRVVWPGLMISLTVLSVNFIGDGLRDALDPKLRSK